MTFYYSAATRSFYHASIHDTPPADAVEISARKHARLLEGQSMGREIVAGPDGRPMLAKAPTPKLPALRARAIEAVKREARRRILLIATLERQSNDNAQIALAAVGNLLGNAADDRERTMAALRRRAAIDAVRAASNTIETTIADMRADALTQFDATSSTLWPRD